MSPHELIDGPTPSGIPGAGTLLEVRDIVTQFRTPRGLLNAVNGILRRPRSWNPFLDSQITFKAWIEVIENGRF